MSGGTALALGEALIDVRVLLFAAYREIVGQRELRLRVTPGATADDLFRLVQREYPRIADLHASTSYAVNRSVVEGSRVLNDGDEVAFLQPVSGGAHD